MAKSKIIKGTFEAPWERELMDELADPFEKENVRQVESNVVEEVLIQHLDREPQLKDLKKVVIKMFDGVNHHSELYYDGVYLGDINKYIYEDKVKVVFNPKK